MAILLSALPMQKNWNWEDFLAFFAHLPLHLTLCRHFALLCSLCIFPSLEVFYLFCFYLNSGLRPFSGRFCWNPMRFIQAIILLLETDSRCCHSWWFHCFNAAIRIIYAGLIAIAEMQFRDKELIKFNDIVAQKVWGNWNSIWYFQRPNDIGMCLMLHFVERKKWSC